MNDKNRLTPKQEKFVQNLFNGMSQRKAYIQAGYSDNSSDAVIDVRACELAKSSKVSGRLSELQKAAEEKAVMTRAEILARLSDIAREEITNRHGVPIRGSNLQAMAELNKMQGHYAPEKFEHDINVKLMGLLGKLRGYGGDKETPEVESLIEGNEDM